MTQKYALLIIGLILGGCVAIKVPDNFNYREIKTRDFNLASWQKINQPNGVYKIYIEGDGYAFDRNGMPTRKPTPRGTLLRKLAFGDSSPNVIYLARPCQYITSPICTQRHWTTARFAPEVINSEYEAVKQIAGNHPVILIGYSGGAQVAGLISTAKTGVNVKKLITIGGNLNHLAWTTYQNLPPLNESLNLESYRQQYLKLPQIHYVGHDDKIMPPKLIKDFVGNAHQVVVVEDADHSSGWEKMFSKIWNEN